MPPTRIPFYGRGSPVIPLRAAAYGPNAAPAPAGGPPTGAADASRAFNGRAVARGIAYAGLPIATEFASLALEGTGHKKAARRIDSMASMAFGGAMSGAFAGGMLGGPAGAVAGGVAGAIGGVAVGMMRAYREDSKEAADNAEELRKSLGAVKIGAFSSMREIMLDDSSSSLKAKIEGIAESIKKIQQTRSLGLFDEKETKVAAEQERLLKKMLDLAKDRQSITARKEATRALAAIDYSDQQEEDIGGRVRLASRKDAMKSRFRLSGDPFEATNNLKKSLADDIDAMEKRLKTNDYAKQAAASSTGETAQDLIGKDAQRLASLRNAMSGVKQSQQSASDDAIGNALQMLQATSAAAMGRRGDSLGAVGIGSGGGGMSGVERNTKEANQLLKRIADSVSATGKQQTIGVYA